MAWPFNEVPAERNVSVWPLSRANAISAAISEASRGWTTIAGMARYGDASEA